MAIRDNYNRMKFRFWCTTEIPEVYDDALSYYEVLNKCVNYINHMIRDVANMGDNVKLIADSQLMLEDFVNKTFEDILNDFIDSINNDLVLDAIMDRLDVDGIKQQLEIFILEKTNEAMDTLKDSIAGLNEEYRAQIDAFIEEQREKLNQIGASYVGLNWVINSDKTVNYETINSFYYYNLITKLEDNRTYTVTVEYEQLTPGTEVKILLGENIIEDRTLVQLGESYFRAVLTGTNSGTDTLKMGIRANEKFIIHRVKLEVGFISTLWVPSTKDTNESLIVDYLDDVKQELDNVKADNETTRNSVDTVREIAIENGTGLYNVQRYSDFLSKQKMGNVFKMAMYTYSMATLADNNTQTVVRDYDVKNILGLPEDVDVDGNNTMVLVMNGDSTRQGYFTMSTNYRPTSKDWVIKTDTRFTSSDGLIITCLILFSKDGYDYLELPVSESYVTMFKGYREGDDWFQDASGPVDTYTYFKYKYPIRIDVNKKYYMTKNNGLQSEGYTIYYYYLDENKKVISYQSYFPDGNTTNALNIPESTKYIGFMVRPNKSSNIKTLDDLLISIL